MKNQKVKANVRIIVISVVVAILVLATVGSLLYIYAFTNLDVDLKEVKTVGTSIEVKRGENGSPTEIYKKNADGCISDEPIKILSFTDTHLDAKKQKGSYTVKYMLENIYRERPDLVVIVGDVVTGGLNHVRVKQFSEMMEKLGVYWIAVLGNHEGDNAFSMSRKDIIEKYASYPHCLIDGNEKHTADGELVWGSGNTQINVLGSEGRVRHSLFFIDSGNEISKEDAQKYNVKEDTYDYVKPSQIRWYSESLAKLPSGTESSIFLHIALCEFEEALKDAPKKADGTLDYGAVSENGTQPLFGGALENVCCSKHNSGLFEAVLRGGSTKTIVCGHDHVNDFRIVYKGVTLCYNRGSGYSSYNAYTKNKQNKLGQGATIYTINTDGKVSIEDVLNSEKFDISDAYKLYK